MSGSNSFASLSPSLLARKGGARPAMRPQLQPIQPFNEATARMLEDDLGWNDHGEDQFCSEQTAGSDGDGESANVISLNGADLPVAEVPAVRRQQAAAANRIAKQSVAKDTAQDFGSTKSKGRRAAFTLRLDAERHLRLRLASTIDSRSAQQIVTEALDRLLAEMPDVEELAVRIATRS